MPAKIPVFVSAPSALSSEQQATYGEILELLERENLERRALGRSDYPSEYPLKEVYLIAKRCSGALVLGFSQMYAQEVISKPGTASEVIEKDRKFPTPWNQLEAGILFSLRLPLMVLHEKGVTGGVFDHGVTDVFLGNLPLGGFPKVEKEAFIFSLQNWVGRVREHYRRWD